MSGDRFQGAARQMAGNVEEVAGRVAGDAKLQARGRFNRAAGSVQHSYGMAMQDFQDFADRLRLRTREQPLVALLAAAAIGYLIGRVGRWL
jgi:uncharacterized protein YjbJ (UPF0337 family)